jgi:hypothetical protein
MPVLLRQQLSDRWLAVVLVNLAMWLSEHAGPDGGSFKQVAGELAGEPALEPPGRPATFDDEAVVEACVDVGPDDVTCLLAVEPAP